MSYYFFQFFLVIFHRRSCIIGVPIKSYDLKKDSKFDVPSNVDIESDAILDFIPSFFFM